MNSNELKSLLYRSYALGFEAGVNNGSHYKMDECWERQKYSFEGDIEAKTDAYCQCKFKHQIKWTVPKCAECGLPIRTA